MKAQRTRYNLSGKRVEGSVLYSSRWTRHQGIDLIALAKRRSKNKVARRSRRINRLRAGR